VVFWNFLSDLLLSALISSLKIFMWASLSSLWHLSLFCWCQQLGMNFLHFPLNPLFNCFFGGECSFHPFFSPLLQLMLCNYVLEWLVHWLNFCCDQLGWCAVSVLDLEV
jgi:hypothetical protein